MSYRPIAWLSLLAAGLLSGTGTAAGQMTLRVAKRPYTAFASFHLDGGVARSFEPGSWGLLGGAAGGVGLYDGDHIWDFTVGARGIRGAARAATVSGAWTTIENGIGLHAVGMWDLGRRAPGAGAGLSFSLLNLEGDFVFGGRPSTSVALYISVPVGFLAYLALGGRR